jgi:hypothetical protein
MSMELLIELDRSIGTPTYNSTMTEKQKTYQFLSQIWGEIELSWDSPGSKNSNQRSPESKENYLEN